jgi:hypothetical protein
MTEEYDNHFDIAWLRFLAVRTYKYPTMTNKTNFTLCDYNTQLDDK